MNNDDLWTRITAAFFRKAETPPSDIFVSRVMARIDELNEPAFENSWFRWLVPSFGFGFAALLFTLTFSSARAELSAETLFTAGAQTDSQVIFSDNASENEAVLGIAAEDLQ